MVERAPRVVDLQHVDAHAPQSRRLEAALLS
jgi:hypothetical protein